MAQFAGFSTMSAHPATDPRRLGPESGHLVADPIGHQVRFSPLGVPESLKSSEHRFLLVVGHLIKQADVGLDCLHRLAPPRSRIAIAAPTRAAAGFDSSFMTLFSVLMASSVHSFAAALTSAIAFMAAVAFSSAFFLGRPGPPGFPGLKDVERLLPLTA
jgi:hypothetical protein